MLERRLNPLFWVALFCIAFACAKPADSSEPPRPRAAQTPQEKPAKSVEQLDYVEVITGRAGPEDKLPMIIAIHGLGDSPEGFSGIVRGFGEPARVILPRGPEKYHNGFSWFSIRGTDWEDGAWVGELSRSAERIAALIRSLRRKRPTLGKPLVMGFSQGGMLSFTLAAHHSEEVGLAIPVGGFLPKSITPDKASAGAMPRLVAFNGEADTIIPFQLALKTLKRLKPLDVDMKLKGFPKVAHRIPPPMRAAIFSEVEAYLKALAPNGP